MAPMTEVINGTSFIWKPKAQIAFQEIKDKLTRVLMLALPCFERVFKVDCGVSSIGMGGILVQTQIFHLW